MTDDPHINRRHRPDVEHDGNEALDDDGLGTETTTLLDSDTSSGTLRNGSPSRVRRRRESDLDSNAAKQTVGPLRAVAIIFSTWVLIFLQASNMSGMTMTQSVVAEELEAYENAMWFTSAYLIATSSLAPLFGRLATIFSPRSLVLPIGMFFAMGGFITSQAHSFAPFILGRIFTGTGGAGIMTLSVVMVLELTTKRRRGIFIGLINAGFTIGLSFGAVVFGALLPVMGWRTLFGIQAPIAIVAALGVFASIPKSFSSNHASKDRSLREKLARIDYAGAFMLTFTIVLFLYGLSGDIKWLPIILSFFTLIIFLVIEFFFAADPIIPLKVLSSRGVLFSCVAQLCMMSARWTLLFYTPIFVLAVKGLAPAVAGSILIPTNFGFGSGGLIVGWLHVRRSGSFWLPSLVGIACFGTSMFALSLVGTPDVAPWLFILVVLLNCLATGATLNYTLAHILHLSHPDMHFITTSLLGTFRGFGGSFGTAIGGGVFYRILRQSLVDGFSDLDGGLANGREELIKKLIGSPALVNTGGLSPAEHEIAVAGYAAASRGTWQVAAGTAILVFVLQAATGWTAPPREQVDDDEAEARAGLMQNEGVAED